MEVIAIEEIFCASDGSRDLSMRSQTSIFPFLLVIKNTPGLVGDHALPVRGTEELQDFIKASLWHPLLPQCKGPPTH